MPAAGQCPPRAPPSAPPASAMDCGPRAADPAQAASGVARCCCSPTTAAAQAAFLAAHCCCHSPGKVALPLPLASSAPRSGPLGTAKCEINCAVRCRRALTYPRPLHACECPVLHQASAYHPRPFSRRLPLYSPSRPRSLSAASPGPATTAEASSRGQLASFSAAC